MRHTLPFRPIRAINPIRQKQLYVGSVRLQEFKCRLSVNTARHINLIHAAV